MTIQELQTALTDAGFDSYYGVAPDDTVAPYIVLRSIYHENVFADDKTYFPTTELTLTLVEPYEHDFNLAANLERVLDNLHLPYSTDESWLPSEHVVETYYEIAFYGGTINTEES